MVQTPVDPSVAQMQAPNTTKRMVKIRALTPIVVGKDATPVGVGQVIEVTEEDAKEFADRIFVGSYSVSGEHGEAFAEQSRHKVKRAERVQ